jgi:hypothetical protein
MLIGDLRGWVLAHAHKPNLDPRQYLHFLALAIVVVAALRGREHWLARRWARPFVKLGQQALIVFVSGMALSHVGGMVLATYGTGPLLQLAVNGGAFALLFALAYGAAWIKHAPWKESRTRPLAAAVPAAASAPAEASLPLAGVASRG